MKNAFSRFFEQNLFLFFFYSCEWKIFEWFFWIVDFSLYFFLFIAGFVPGENIFFSVSINNKSSRDINSITVMLVHEVTVYAGAAANKQRDEIAKMRFDQCRVGSGGQGTFTNLRLKIPPTCPSLLNSCRIIKNQYNLELKLDAHGLASMSKYLKIPIEIGTVPIDKCIVSDVSSKISNVKYQPYRPRGLNNDGQVRKKVCIDFYDPLYPVLMDLT